MNAIQWAGTVAGALIAIGTVVRWTLRRLVRGARWVGAVIELPETVDRLSTSVDTLRVSVDRLSAAVDRPELERLCTRPGHACGEPHAGPCNGLPRHLEAL